MTRGERNRQRTTPDGHVPGPGVDGTVEADLRRRVGRLPLERKVRLLTGADTWTLYEEPLVGLGRMVLSDGPAGVRGTRGAGAHDPSVNVPCPSALGATFDPALVRRIGNLLAEEARRKGVHVVLAPTVNLHRTPYNGRHFECFSEDPLLSARLCTAYVEGLQERGVAATVKHFVANDSETQRRTLDARIDERTLRELYLRPFEVAVREAGVWSVMAAYNGVNGATMTESPLLRTVLRQEWGFDGVVMSDWKATTSTEASAAAALDLVMPGPAGPWGTALVEAVERGAVPEAEIDEKVLRLLRLAARVGILDAGARDNTTARLPGDALRGGAGDDRASGEVGELLRRAAAASFVLLRNEPAAAGAAPLLPLDPAALGTVAVIGPNAATARTFGGGSAAVHPTYTVSPLVGIRSALGDRAVHSSGARPTDWPLPATNELVTDPENGMPGMRMRLLDGTGAELASVHRGAGRAKYRPKLWDNLDITRVAVLELTAVLTAPADGEHLVGVAGTGALTLDVDGERIVDDVLSHAPATDFLEGLIRPPSATRRVALRAGQQVRLVVRRAMAPGEGETFLTLLAEPPARPDEELLAEAERLAAQADVAIVVVGTTAAVETEDLDRPDLRLPGRQDELVERVAAVNPRTVVVVNAGAPVLMPWASAVPAVLLTWFAGQELGNALADVLFGAAEPGGRLPSTWPAEEGPHLPGTVPDQGVLRYDEKLHIGYRRYGDGLSPAWWFGHGLGYTSWTYEELVVPGPVVVADGRVPDVRVQVRLRNTGSRPGREVVQAYLARPDSAVERPRLWLAGFASVQASPGGRVTADITVPGWALQHWDGGAWACEPGRLVLAVGRSSADLRLDGVLVVEVPGQESAEIASRR